MQDVRGQLRRPAAWRWEGRKKRQPSRTFRPVPSCIVAQLRRPLGDAKLTFSADHGSPAAVLPVAAVARELLPRASLAN